MSGFEPSGLNQNTKAGDFMKSSITVGLLMSALLLPVAVLAETTRCTPKGCKALTAEEAKKKAQLNKL
ncbi:hypothetical protein ARAF_3008 [Arsenophonus endosymbiont of Aleurodicus floccissimus]|uniref:hypothetical protein n=1 Tax=Arsenophonus endosymbiont of Aleurodicus floccissimus TaxID=2152761 RepID=UPI000E6B418D|nr:hypothetical protein [Arsenophonus endosymbiont of Aleurodicus floccissimus]SPP32641.1 hypothetical protein ARAF_3008 [Arsenophonus endosymbiont of Aleurodicus floccissimus]